LRPAFFSAPTWNVVAGGFNNDGKVDAAILSPAANTITVFLGIGDGSFQGGVAYRLQGEINSPNSITTADVNGDGKLDLIVANLNSLNVGGGGAISVLLGNGDGTFQAQVDYALPTHPAIIIPADINGDAKPDLALTDLALTNNYTASVSIPLNRGDGTFGAPVEYSVGNVPYDVAVGDFNADGKADLVVTNYCVLSYNVLPVGSACGSNPSSNTTHQHFARQRRRDFSASSDLLTD
jgi:hypothetical protein